MCFLVKKIHFTLIIRLMIELRLYRFTITLAIRRKNLWSIQTFDYTFSQFLNKDVVRSSLELGYHSNGFSLAPNEII